MKHREGRLRRLEFIRATSRILDLDFEIAIEAGGISEELKVEAKGWGLADSIVLCTARSLKGTSSYWRRTFPPLGQRDFSENII